MVPQTLQARVYPCAIAALFRLKLVSTNWQKAAGSCMHLIKKKKKKKRQSQVYCSIPLAAGDEGTAVACSSSEFSS